MLIGDYTMQCRKHLGTCICYACAQQAEARAASERRRWYYEEVLSAYAKQLSADPKRYEEELRDAEHFVETLQASISPRPQRPPLSRARSGWERSRQ